MTEGNTKRFSEYELFVSEIDAIRMLPEHVACIRDSEAEAVTTSSEIVSLGVLPSSHSFGIAFSNTSSFVGRTTTLLRRWNP